MLTDDAVKWACLTAIAVACIATGFINWLWVLLLVFWLTA